MQATLHTALVLLVLLQVKHLFGDFFLQSQRMLTHREIYLHLGRGQHACLHAALSCACFLIVGAPVGLAITLSVVEFFAHYHIDFIKGRYSALSSQTPADAGFWRAFGVDQLAHQLTYIAMIWAWSVYAV